MTLFALILAAGLGMAAGAPPVTVIVGATLVDGGGRAPLPDSIVVLRGANVAAVGDRMRTPIPKGAALVDGRGLWVAPVPDTGVPGPGLLTAVAALLRGPAPRVVAGQPAHVAMLDADPRREGIPASSLRRLWIAGKVRPIPPAPAP